MGTDLQVDLQRQLFVFEGPDGVGKSTLAKALTGFLQKNDIPCDLMTFPGRESGTLGSLVYEIHHNAGPFRIGTLHPTSLQLLHIAAHVDAIEHQIRPAIAAGRTVVLDRFWWSTWVYGVEGGVPRESLRDMIGIEITHWEGIEPDAIFLIHRDTPHRAEHDAARFDRLNNLYLDLSSSSPDQKVHLLKNERTVDSELERLVEIIHGA